MPITAETLSIAYWKLLRVGPRAKSVVFRHQQEPRVAPFAQTMPPLVDAFLEQHLELANLQTDAQTKNRQAASDAGVLTRELRHWVHLAVAHIPALDTTELSQRPSVLEHLVHQARILISQVQQHGPEHALSYAPALQTQLQTLIERAESSAAIADTAMSVLAARRAAVRETGAALYNQVLELRRDLRSLLGTQHRDYRKLRLSTLHKTDVDPDDATDAAAPDATDAAATPNAAAPAPPTQPADPREDAA
jgi:hypothetical protein